MTAFKAEAQMHPSIADFDAIFANMSLCFGESNLTGVFAMTHLVSPSCFELSTRFRYCGVIDAFLHLPDAAGLGDSRDPVSGHFSGI